MNLAKPLVLALVMAVSTVASEKRETTYPDGTTRTIYYVNTSDGAELKEGHEREYYPGGQLKRETIWRENRKHGLERHFDEEGLEISTSRWAEGKLIGKEETFESSNEARLGKRFLVVFNPTPILIGLAVASLADRDLAIPVLPVELGALLGGYYALKAAPAVVMFGEGGWGMQGGVAIMDLPGSWIGSQFECRYTYYDIVGYGNSWNVVGSYYHNFSLPRNLLWFWGANIGYGFNGVTLVKSLDRETGQSQIYSRDVEEGIFLSFNGGFGYNF